MWHCFKLRCVRNPGTFSARPRQSFALDFLNIPQSFLFTRSPSFQPCCHFQSVFSLAPILLQIKGVQLTFCDENVGCQVWLWGTDVPAPKFWLMKFLPDPGVSGVRSLGPGVSTSLQDLFETLLVWLWLMMIPSQYDWWCQYKAIPGNS